MRCLLTLAAMCVIAAPALASPDILPVTGMRYGTYDMSSNTFRPSAGPVRYGDSVWTSTTRSGYFTSITDDGWAVLDFGDIAGPQDIGGFAFSYATYEVLPTRMSTFLLFYAEENGRNSADRVYLMGFRITNLPTGDPSIPPEFNGWTVTVDLEPSGDCFTIDGSDLDFDGKVDFGYIYFFPLDLDRTGPTIAGDPNVDRDMGIEDFFEAFATTDPNIDPSEYDGAWWFRSPTTGIFAQFYLELFDAGPNCAPQEGCPLPGDSGKFCTADIDEGPQVNCIVDLADLAQLLSNYGTTSGAEWGDGDVDPPQPGGGDGDVDLGDLAELLSQYNDICE